MPPQSPDTSCAPAEMEPPSAATRSHDGRASIAVLTPPPISLLSPLSAWRLFTDYFLDADADADAFAAPPSGSYATTPRLAASTSGDAERRHIIASLSERPDHGSNIGSNTFARYARLKQPSTTGQDRNRHMHGPRRPAAGAQADSDSKVPLTPSSRPSIRHRAKSVEEKITQLGWFWDSDAPLLWPEVPSKRKGAWRRRSQDGENHNSSSSSEEDEGASVHASSAKAIAPQLDQQTFLDQYATGQLDLNTVEQGCPCPSMMMQAPLPACEDARKRMICRSGIFALSPSIAQRLYTISTHVRDALNMPLSILDVLYGEEGWEITADAIEHHNNYRRETVCAHTILNARRGLTIPDIRADWRFTGSHVLGPINFYSGFPITSSSGLPLGALCVMDVQSHDSFTDEQKGLLQLAADQISYIIERNFADHFLLKMQRMATTHEMLLNRLTNMSARSLPRFDPVTFSLGRPLAADDRVLSLDSRNADGAMSLDRCCQRIAAAMDLDAVYIAAYRADGPSTATNRPGGDGGQTLARSGLMCPTSHPSSAQDLYRQAFDGVDEEGCAIFQNALNVETRLPLPSPEGHSAGQHFACALVLPLASWRRRDVAGHASTVQIVLVAASIQQRHVLGIEDLRFLQSLQPHLSKVVHQVIHLAGGTSPRKVHSSLARQDRDVPTQAGSRQPHSGQRGGAPSPKSSDRRASAKGTPSSLQQSPVGSSADSIGTGSSPAAQHFQQSYHEHLRRVSPAERRSSSPTGIPQTQSSWQSRFQGDPLQIRSGSIGGPLTRLTSPLKLKQAASTLRHTLHLQHRRPSLGTSSTAALSSRARGSADSSTGLSLPSDSAGASSSFETSISSGSWHEDVRTEASAGPSSPAASAFEFEKQTRLDYRRGSASSSSTSSLTPTPTPKVFPSLPEILPHEGHGSSIEDTAQVSKSARNEHRGGSQDQHRSSILSMRKRFRRPMSAKAHNDGQMTSESAEPKWSPREAPGDGQATRLTRGGFVTEGQGLRSRSQMCQRCLGCVPDQNGDGENVRGADAAYVVQAATPPATLSKSYAGRSIISPRRPRTAGDHDRKPLQAGGNERSSDQGAQCSCIMPLREDSQAAHSGGAGHGKTTLGSPPQQYQQWSAAGQHQSKRPARPASPSDEMQEIMLADEPAGKAARAVDGFATTVAGSERILDGERVPTSPRTPTMRESRQLSPYLDGSGNGPLSLPHAAQSMPSLPDSVGEPTNLSSSWQPPPPPLPMKVTRAPVPALSSSWTGFVGKSLGILSGDAQTQHQHRQDGGLSPRPRAARLAKVQQ